MLYLLCRFRKCERKRPILLTFYRDSAPNCPILKCRKYNFVRRTYFLQSRRSNFVRRLPRLYFWKVHFRAKLPFLLTCYRHFLAKTCNLQRRNHDFLRRTCFLHTKMTGHDKSIVSFRSENGGSFLAERVIFGWRWWNLSNRSVNLASLFNDFLRICIITKCRNHHFFVWCSFPRVRTTGFSPKIGSFLRVTGYTFRNEWVVLLEEWGIIFQPSSLISETWDLIAVSR
jgi:hypothetical protein